MPLFQIAQDNRVRRISAGYFDKERYLQQLVEANLFEIFGVQFIASEFVIRGEQPGRIDTLGLDTDGAPTIIEYKRSESEAVINQGLYYMNWLLEHRGDFVVAARDALGHDVEVNWTSPRLIILAQGYAKWDTHAVKLMGEGIELWSYTRYGDDLLHLELVYGQPRMVPVSTPSSEEGASEVEPEYTVEYHLAKTSERVRSVFNALREGIFAWAGEEGDIIETPNKLYISYRHGKNFCEVQVQARALKVFIDISPAELQDPHGMGRDVSSVGHWGTGHVQVKIDDIDQVGYVLGLIEQAYRLTL